MVMGRAWHLSLPVIATLHLERVESPGPGVTGFYLIHAQATATSPLTWLLLVFSQIPIPNVFPIALLRAIEQSSQEAFLTHGLESYWVTGAFV